MFTQPTNEGKTIAEHPIKPHFLQQFPNCPKLCTCVTLPVQRPKLVVGAHGKDTLEVVASQVLSSPSVRHGNWQCSLSLSLRLIMLKRQPWLNLKCTKRNATTESHIHFFRCTPFFVRTLLSRARAILEAEVITPGRPRKSRNSPDIVRKAVGVAFLSRWPPILAHTAQQAFAASLVDCGTIDGDTSSVSQLLSEAPFQPPPASRRPPPKEMGLGFGIVLPAH